MSNYFVWFGFDKENDQMCFEDDDVYNNGGKQRREIVHNSENRIRKKKVLIEKNIRKEKKCYK